MVTVERGDVREVNMAQRFRNEDLKDQGDTSLKYKQKFKLKDFKEGTDLSDYLFIKRTCCYMENGLSEIRLESKKLLESCHKNSGQRRQWQKR